MDAVPSFSPFCGPFAEQRQLLFTVVPVGVIADDAQNVRVFIARLRVFRNKGILENPVAGSAAVTLHCLAIQRYDGVAGSHCSARSACLRLVPGLDRQHDLCAVHNLFPIGQIRFDLNLAADRRIGDVDGEFILLSGGRLRGDCEGVFTRASVAVDCQLDRAGGLGGQRQVSAVTGAEQADRADLHIAVRVPAVKVRI